MKWIGPLMLSALLWACAQMESPPGGPVDRTAPLVEGHYPPAGSTGVSAEVELSIAFSERMDRSTVEEALFISPALGQPPRLKWRGRTLRVRPKDPLRPDQTYVVTLGVGCKDLHNNKLLNSYSFAFSTGQAIDQGRISGMVSLYRHHDGDIFPPRGGVDLWAYRLSTGQDPDPAVDPPDYVTQTDEQGRFQLTHLGKGRYRVFAVEDHNRDRRWNASEELFGVPSADLDLADEPFSITLGPMGVVMLDTLGPSLEQARALHRGAVILSFDEDLDSARAVNPEAYHIEPLEEPPDTVDLLAVSLSWGHPNEVILSTTTQRAGSPYQVTVTGLIDRVGNVVRPEGRRARLIGVGWADTVGPRLQYAWPPDSSDQISPWASPTLFFNEAVDGVSLENAFSLVDTSGLAVEGDFRFLHGAAAAFIPQQSLGSDRWYVLSLKGFAVRDGAGNATADSAMVIRFKTLDEEQLGSISGAVDKGGYSSVATAIILVSGPAGNPRYRRHQARGNDYHLDHMRPGTYIMGAFLDLNEDGLWNPGRPVPFASSEPLWVAKDSVSVRSRWETAEVNVTFQP
jgi:uncharacterized protein (DUF2141 family)